MYTFNCKADTCNVLKLSSECMECKLIKEEEAKRIKELLEKNKMLSKEKKVRKIMGGTC